jgi:hypothetical protein
VHLQSAAAVGAARQRLAPGALIGVSAHGLDDVAAAAAAGADYVTLSPIFLTSSKPCYGPALGVAAIGPAASLEISVVALGGVAADLVRPCLAAGAAGVAVMGEIMRSDNPGRTVGGLLDACTATTMTDELAEEELLEEEVAFRKDATGIDNTIFISPRGKTRHAPRIKLAIDPPDSINPGTEAASIAIHDGSVVAGENVQAALLRQVRRFIDLNRDTLLDYWEYRIDGRQLDRRLKRI